jgi:hypothetical protein
MARYFLERTPGSSPGVRSMYVNRSSCDFFQLANDAREFLCTYFRAKIVENRVAFSFEQTYLSACVQATQRT